MLKKYILKAALFLTLLGGGACENYLELKPETGLVREDFWQTKEQVESVVFVLYASMMDEDFATKTFLWGELRGGMIIPSVGAAFDEREVYNGNILPNNDLANWSSFYETINLCNTLLELAPAVLERDPTFSEETLEGYLGEALAIRSLCYFYLVRGFRDVPLKLDATTNDGVNFNLPKSSEAEILEQIEEDLIRAESMAVGTYEQQNYNKGRITKNAVNAILADVYLWKGDYQGCIDACNKVINSGKYGLLAANDQDLWFQQMYGVGNSVESIFELQFSQQKNNPFYGMFSQSVNRSFVVAPNVVTEVFTIDEENPLNSDIRLSASVNVSTNEVWKYLGVTLRGRRSSNDSDANWIFYRYADILLMKAEALALTGRGEEAIALIERVRDRANALEETAKVVNAENTEGIIEYILEERAREFAFEGKRWFDLLRVARRDDYARLDLLLNAVLENAPAERMQSIITKYRDINSHYWPILQVELNRNPNLVQNPFYKSF